jgi:hypothetical protein
MSIRCYYYRVEVVKSLVRVNKPNLPSSAVFTFLFTCLISHSCWRRVVFPLPHCLSLVAITVIILSTSNNRLLWKIRHSTTSTTTSTHSPNDAYAICLVDYLIFYKQQYKPHFLIIYCALPIQNPRSVLTPRSFQACCNSLFRTINLFQ